MATPPPSISGSRPASLPTPARGPARRPSAAALAAAAVLSFSAACAPSPGSQGATPSARRAIFVSFDALNEVRARRTVLPAEIPTLLQFFDQASCADGARPMFPSYTAASHAALWTGAYGNVNGVAGNSMVPLPWNEFSIAETRSGYDSRQLAAEPIWIAAGRAGLATVAHHVTQAPGAPGYWRAQGRDTVRVRQDSLTLADPRLFVVNGYGPTEEARLITAAWTHPKPAAGWKNLDRLGAVDVPFREASWPVAGDSLHALFFGRGGYREVVVSQERDAARGVRVRPASVERDSPAGRELARHFSEVLWLENQGDRAGAYFRLWELAPDLSTYELFQSRIHRGVAANHRSALAEYQQAVGAFIGNSESGLLREGAFGPRLQGAGDGTAELKYLETAELATRQFIRGSAWAWRTRRPALHVEYFPLADDLDHLWFGVVSPEVPGYDPALGARLNALRSRGWALVDRRLSGLRELAHEADALLLVSGDHGMRPTWRFFQVNVALRDAGLLVLRDNGRVDLTGTRAFSPNGYYVHVNRGERTGGIVPPDQVDRVADSVTAVLRAARAPDGRPLVPRIWRPTPDDTLGIGGPAGGEVYFDLATGYYYSSRLDSLTSAMTEAGGSHGFPSIHPDMRTVLCATGPGVGGRRLPTARIIDAAPTVAEWLGIDPPREARGRSLLGMMRVP